MYLWAGAYTSFAGDQPAVRYTSTTLGFRKEYPITDHLGSIRVVLTPDERQSIVSRSDYEPFGAPLANGRERLSFIGKEQDNESSLGDFGVRKYDPSLGRFMSVDALLDLMPGSSPFHYCFNNPLILRDPSGLIGEIGGDGIPRFTTGEVVVYGERDNSSEDVIRDRKLEWMAKRAAAAAADMAPRAQGGGGGLLGEILEGIEKHFNGAIGTVGISAQGYNSLPKNTKRAFSRKLSKLTGIKAGRLFQGIKRFANSAGKWAARLGPAGTALGVIVQAYEYGSGTWDAHTVVNTVLMAGAFAATFYAVPAVLTGIAIYGVADYIFGLDGMIDKTIGRDSQLWRP